MSAYELETAIPGPNRNFGSGPFRNAAYARAVPQPTHVGSEPQMFVSQEPRFGANVDSVLASGHSAAGRFILKDDANQTLNLQSENRLAAACPQYHRIDGPAAGHVLTIVLDRSVEASSQHSAVFESIRSRLGCDRRGNIDFMAEKLILR